MPVSGSLCIGIGCDNRQWVSADLVHDAHDHGADRSGRHVEDLSRRAGEIGGTLPAVLNAANEVAVAAFLDKQIPFLAIPRLIEEVLSDVPVTAVNTLEDVVSADATARSVANDLMKNSIGAS